MKRIIFILIMIIPLVSASQGFNIEIELPESYESVLAGENIWFTSKLINFGNNERMDVTLIYEVLDGDKKLQAMKKETVAIETQASFVSNIKIPKHLEHGLYFLKVSCNSTLGLSTAMTTFHVIKKETQNQFIIKLSLFDIIVDIPDNYKKIHAGEELLTSIKLINVGSSGRVDVFLDYTITGPDGSSIITKRETVAVETQANFVRTFDIPKEARPGTYKITAQINYADGKYAVSDNMFEIVNKFNLEKYFYIGGALIIIMLLAVVMIKNLPDFDKIKMKLRIASIVRRKMKKK